MIEEIKAPSVYHVIPLNDLRVHRTKADCPCQPMKKDGLIVHNSFDGREFFEKPKEQGH